jgi:raffinose/stachyose/melibiose transport system permease protein
MAKIQVASRARSEIRQQDVAERRRGKRRARRSWKQVLQPYLWLSPALLVYGLFKLYPMISGVWLALLKWDGVTDPVFIGLRNFQRMFSDDQLGGALLHNVQYALGTVVGKIVLSLILAVLLTQSLRGRGAYRTALFMPVVMSFVVVSFMWMRMYDYQFGVINNLLRGIGLGALAQDWLGNPRLALWSEIVVDIWKWYGFHMVIFLAGLQTIPTELYEAARVDGASRIRQFFSVTLPLLQPVMLINVTVSLAGALNAFDIPYLMTEGGPDNATNVLGLHIYQQAFQFNKLGYGAALSYALFAFVTVIVLLQLRYMAPRRDSAEGNG